MSTYEGRWNCKQCSHVNRGGSVECEGCGKDRPNDVEFYLPENEPAVTDPVKLAAADAGPDRHCIHCGSVVPGTTCPKCGGSGVTMYETMTFPKSAFEPRPPGLREPEPCQHEYFAHRRPQPPWWPLFAILGICAVGTLLFFLAFGAKTGKLEHKTWTRTIDIEQLKTVRKTDWHDYVPTGARPINQFTALRNTLHIQSGTEPRYRTVQDRVQTGTTRVKTGTKNTGNGYFKDVYEDRPVYSYVSRQEVYNVPVYHDQLVYDTKVEYEIDRWAYDHAVTATGTDDEPYWPGTLEITTTGGSKVGDQRTAGRHESYHATFKTPKGEIVQDDIDAGKYSVLNKTSTYKLSTVFGGVSDIQEIKAEKE